VAGHTAPPRSPRHPLVPPVPPGYNPANSNPEGPATHTTRPHPDPRAHRPHPLKPGDHRRLAQPDDGSESTPIERGHFNRRADLNGDGQIDADDMALLQAELGQQHPTADWHVRTPRFMSFRNAELVPPAAVVALCPFGHQGLMHDEELAPGGSAPGAGGGLIHNRARTLHPGVGRFMQRDPLNQNMAGGGYQDGMSLYQPLERNPLIQQDPTGTFSCRCGQEVGHKLRAGLREMNKWWHSPANKSHYRQICGIARGYRGNSSWDIDELLPYNFGMYYSGGICLNMMN